MPGTRWHLILAAVLQSSTAEPLKGPGWLTQAYQIHGEVIRGMAWRESGWTCRASEASSQTRYSTWAFGPKRLRLLEITSKRQTAR
ncbi:hypothetical protein V8C34DRAFT_291380 [Trichoderma compactum]